MRIVGTGIVGVRGVSMRNVGMRIVRVRVVKARYVKIRFFFKMGCFAAYIKIVKKNKVVWGGGRGGASFGKFFYC